MGNMTSLNQSTILGEEREEGCASNLFPEIIASFVPVLTNVVEVIADDWPDDLLGGLGVSVLDEVVDIFHEGDCSQRRAVALGATPDTVKSSKVDLVFWFTEAGPEWVQRSH